MKRGSDKKRRKEKGKGVVWSKRHNSFHTLLKAIHKSSTVTRNRSKDTKGVTQSHLPEMKRGEKIDKEYFCLSAGSSSTPRLASKISITLLYEMSQVFPSSFALLCSSPFLLWSCHPLWAVIIGRGLSVSSDTVAFEVLSLCKLNRHIQTWVQQTRGNRKDMFDWCLNCGKILDLPSGHSQKLRE